MKTLINNYLKQNKKTLFVFILFISAFAERVFFDTGPNFELVTTALILSSFYIGKKESLATIFLIMFFSDLIIGSTNIFLFTWSGFLIPAIFSKSIIKNLISLFSPVNNHQSLITKKVTALSSLTFTGLAANLFFFFWTNFGVWLLSGMYPKTAFGLLESYINALPFLRYQIISTLIFVPVGFSITELAIFIYKKYFSRYQNLKLLNTN